MILDEPIMTIVSQQQKNTTFTLLDEVIIMVDAKHTIGVVDYFILTNVTKVRLFTMKL